MILSGRDFKAVSAPSACLFAGSCFVRGLTFSGTQRSQGHFVSTTCPPPVLRRTYLSTTCRPCSRSVCLSSQSLFESRWGNTWCSNVQGYTRTGTASVYKSGIHFSAQCLQTAKAHTAATPTWQQTSKQVPVGGHGSVQLDLFTLNQDDLQVTDPAGRSLSTVLSEGHDEDVLVYFPPGLPWRSVSVGDDQDFRNLLAAVAIRSQNERRSRMRVQTVIRVNYRLAPAGAQEESDQDCRFPIPIHDTSVCFDWILEYAGATDPEANLDDVRISLYGADIGGALALTMALTNPNAIHAVAVKDPITDWVGLDELVPPVENLLADETQLNEVLDDDPNITEAQVEPTSIQRKRGVRKTGRTKENEASHPASIQAAQKLINLRTRLFRSASAFFDPFASPLLFLRAPGRDTPPWKTARPEPELELEPEPEVTLHTRSHLGQHAEQSQRQTAFGPYDDDWHAAHHHRGHETLPTAAEKDMDTIAEAIGVDALKRAPESPVSVNPSISLLPPASTPTSTPTPTSVRHEQTPAPKPVKRRKVLRRWPPVGVPEDVLLPYTRIYSTLPRPVISTPLTPPASPPIQHESTQPDDNASPEAESESESEAGARAGAGAGAETEPPVDFATVLNPQAREMVEVMRRTCFWGRDRLFAEERVTLEEISPVPPLPSTFADHESSPHEIGGDSDSESESEIEGVRMKGGALEENTMQSLVDWLGTK